MKAQKNETFLYEVSFYVNTAHYLPVLWKHDPLSFQWAKLSVIPLKKCSNHDDEGKEGFDDAIKTSYTIPAESINEAISKSLMVNRFILNIASFYYSIGLNIKSPPCITELDTGKGVVYDFRRLTFSKDNFCTKIVDTYFPFLTDGGEGSLKFKLDQISSYEYNELFEIDDFHKTIKTFLALYNAYIKDSALRKKIDFSLNILNESQQIPGFVSRFILYWRAFQQLVERPVPTGIVNEKSLQEIISILKKQEAPRLSQKEISRIRDQIRIIHSRSRADLIVDEMRSYFTESEQELRDIYTKLAETRNKLIHGGYKGEEIPNLWFDTELLKSIVRQMVGVHVGYKKSELKMPSLKDFRVRSAPKPVIHIGIGKPDEDIASKSRIRK